MLPGYHPLLQAADRVLLASSGGGIRHEAGGGQGAPEPPWPAALRTSFRSLQASVHPNPSLTLTPTLTLTQPPTPNPNPNPSPNLNPNPNPNPNQVSVQLGARHAPPGVTADGPPAEAPLVSWLLTLALALAQAQAQA